MTHDDSYPYGQGLQTFVIMTILYVMITPPPYTSSYLCKGQMANIHLKIGRKMNAKCYPSPSRLLFSLEIKYKRLIWALEGYRSNPDTL